MPYPYGTVMIARLAAPFDELQTALDDWVAARAVPGFRHEDVMLCDDGVTVVTAVRFDSEAEYRALSDDAAQDAWWRERVQPLLDGDVQWFDGAWRVSLDS